MHIKCLPRLPTHVFEYIHGLHCSQNVQIRSRLKALAPYIHITETIYYLKGFEQLILAMQLTEYS